MEIKCMSYPQNCKFDYCNGGDCPKYVPAKIILKGICANCQGTDFTKDGMVRHGKGKRQRYVCKSCGTTTVKVEEINA